MEFSLNTRLVITACVRWYIEVLTIIAHRRRSIFPPRVEQTLQEIRPQARVPRTQAQEPEKQSAK